MACFVNLLILHQLVCIQAHGSGAVFFCTEWRFSSNWRPKASVQARDIILENVSMFACMSSENSRADAGSPLNAESSDSSENERRELRYMAESSFVYLVSA